MAVVRMIGGLLKDATLGPRIVPIVADEARTFGMASLFRQIGIYSPLGQLYEPEDAGSMLVYREAKDGQLLEEGITEAGALASWIAAATAYSVHGLPMLPFYIYYSMFGFQRVGDLIWAAADQRARGFLLGATAGRTTLGGEGLQHQDGSSHVVAATVPNCRAYDPAFAGELAVIVDHGMRAMLERQRGRVLLPHGDERELRAGVARDGQRSGRRRRHVRVRQARRRRRRAARAAARVGTILREVIAAAELLAQDWRVASDVFSVTSFSELARDAREVERWNRLHPARRRGAATWRACSTATRRSSRRPTTCARYPQLIAEYVDADFTALGTDGFGRSDTRAVLRRFFEVDRHHIVVAALDALARRGSVSTRRRSPRRSSATASTRMPRRRGRGSAASDSLVRRRAATHEIEVPSPSVTARIRFSAHGIVDRVARFLHLAGLEHQRVRRASQRHESRRSVPPACPAPCPPRWRSPASS